MDYPAATKHALNSQFHTGICACMLILIALLAFPHLSQATGDPDRGKQLF
jgi:hypothetical protein